MATLTTAEKLTITNLIKYLQNGYEQPKIEHRTLQVLLKMEGKFGFTGRGQVGLQDSLRDAPFSTLLKCLLAVAA